MVDQVKISGCECAECQIVKEYSQEEDKNEISFANMKSDFPTVVSPEGPVKVSIETLESIFNEKLPQERKKQNLVRLLEMMAYVEESELFSVKFFISLCDYVQGKDLECVLTDERLAQDFLYKTTKYLAMAWHTWSVEKNPRAQWIVRQLVSFLTHLVGYPIIAAQVTPVFCSTEKWPKSGPLRVLEEMVQESLLCLHKLSFLANLTRIESFCESLAKETKCIKMIEDSFRGCRSHIEKYDEYGHLLMLLFTNVSRIEEFVKFLIEANNGYFMNIVLVDLISRADSCEPPLNIVWPFLRNLSLLEKGRTMIMDHLDLYLGHLLYPIAGPEKISAEDSVNLPLEVVDLHESKTRVQDKNIRECILDILYSLCRYKKDRVLLRKADVYQILKLYHLAEEDAKLIEKIEDVVNILIRHEGTEIEVDDLMEGLSVNDAQDGVLGSRNQSKCNVWNKSKIENKNWTDIGPSKCDRYETVPIESENEEQSEYEYEDWEYWDEYEYWDENDSDENPGVDLYANANAGGESSDDEDNGDEENDDEDESDADDSHEDNQDQDNESDLDSDDENNNGNGGQACNDNSGRAGEDDDSSDNCTNISMEVHETEYDSMYGEGDENDDNESISSYSSTAEATSTGLVPSVAKHLETKFEDFSKLYRKFIHYVQVINDEEYDLHGSMIWSERYARAFSSVTGIRRKIRSKFTDAERVYFKNRFFGVAWDWGFETDPNDREYFQI